MTSASDMPVGRSGQKWPCRKSQNALLCVFSACSLRPLRTQWFNIFSGKQAPGRKGRKAYAEKTRATLLSRQRRKGVIRHTSV